MGPPTPRWRHVRLAVVLWTWDGYWELGVRLRLWPLYCDWVGKGMEQ